MHLSKISRFLLGAGVTLVFGFPVYVQAQILEEVVVTARKRGEDMQDVPVAMSAFTSADLEAIGVSSMRDYMSQVPNVFMVETQASSFTFVNIRGISQMRNTDPSVAIVIDGVLATTPVTMSQELFDVEQIEVYKGPQGALYGRNSLGGAINITTKRPTNDFEAMIKAGYGNGDSIKTRASVSGALIRDQLYGRAAIAFSDTDGVRDNIANPKNQDERESLSGRVRIIWEPTENFELDIRGSYSDDQSAALGFTDIAPFSHEATPGNPLNLFGVLSPFGVLAGAPTPAINPATGAPNPPPAVGNPAPPFFAPSNPNRFAVVRGGTQVDGSPLTSATQLAVPGQAFNVGNINNTSIPVQNNLNGIDDRRIYGASALINWDLGFATLTSVSAFDQVDQIATGEQPLRSADAVQKNTQARFSEAFSQEIRFTSPSENRLRWIAGAYVVDTETFLGQMAQRDATGLDTRRDQVKRDPSVAPDGICQPVINNGNPGLGPVVLNVFPIGRAGGTNATDPTNPIADLGDNQGACIRGYDGDLQNNFAWAVFGQINYDLTDQWELSFSARFDEDEREQTVRTPNIFLDQELTAPPFVFDPVSGEITGTRVSTIAFGDVRKKKWSSFQPKATIRWTPTDEVMTYVSFAKGFRSGGFNRPAIGPLADQQRGTPGIPPVPLGIEDIFPKQETQSFEGGFKYNSPNGGFVLNAAGYFTTIDNLQTFTAVTFQTGLSQVIIPVEEVEVWGFEVDAAAQVTDNLVINAGLGFTNSEVTKDPVRGNTGNPATSTLGNKAPQTPDSTLNIGATYNTPFNIAGMEGNFFLRTDLQHIGGLFFMVENFVKRDPLTLVNLRGGVEFGDGWRVEGWVKNATNQNYFAEGFNPAGFFFYGALRTYGFEVTKRF